MAELIVRLGDRVISRHPIDKEMLSIGRARDNDIVIENLSVSRNHTKIKAVGGEFSVLDMNSANGTLLNGVRITKADLANDDMITIGKHTIQFVGGSISSNSKPPTTTAVREATASFGVLAPPPPDKPTGMVGVLTVREGKQAGQQFRVFKAETIIGRAPESDVRIHDWYVSKRHAIIARSGETYTLKDLDSWRGMSVNGKQVKEADLRSGDSVMISAVVLDFAIAHVSDVPEPPPAPPIEGSSSDRVPRPSPDDLGPIAEVESIAAASDRNTKSAAAIPLPVPATGFSSAPTSLASGANLPSEFAPPINEDELSALEREAETHLGSVEEETENRRSTWELEESERMFETNALDEGTFTLMDPDAILTAEEEVAVGPEHIVMGPAAMARFISQHEANITDLDTAEEKSLYRRGFTGEAPLGETLDGAGTDQHDGAPAVVSVAGRKSGDQVAQPSGVSRLPAGAASGTNPLPLFAGEYPPEVSMWEKALRNKSALIRKNASKELKKLTGKDYDWQSEPGGP